MQRLFSLLWLPAGILFVWYVSTTFAGITPLILPSPQTVLQTAFDMIESGELAQHVMASGLRAFAGFGLSSTVALVLAWTFSRRPFLERQMHLTLETIRVVPPLSLVPLLILWLGIGEAPKLTIVILASFFPVYLSALNGFRNVDFRYTELAQSLHLTRYEKLVHIDLPASLPAVITGLRLGIGYAWRALVGAELIAAASGLGYLIQDASEMSRSDRMLVGILTIALLGIMVDLLFAFVLNRCAPWVAIREKRNTVRTVC